MLVACVYDFMQWKIIGCEFIVILKYFLIDVFEFIINKKNIF